MKICKKCGGMEFYKNEQCRSCNKEARAKYNKEYRVNNLKNVKAFIAKWAKDNPEKRKASSVTWNKANPGKANSRATAWYLANSEKAKDYVAAWRKVHPETKRIYEQNRKARKRANGGKLSKGLAAKLLKLQQGKCACCRKVLKKYNLDHHMPIALGGSNTDDNIQLLCPTCNQQKHAKHPVDFMQSKGFLI